MWFRKKDFDVSMPREAYRKSEWDISVQIDYLPLYDFVSVSGKTHNLKKFDFATAIANNIRGDSAVLMEFGDIDKEDEISSAMAAGSSIIAVRRRLPLDRQMVVVGSERIMDYVRVLRLDGFRSISYYRELKTAMTSLVKARQ